MHACVACLLLHQRLPPYCRQAVIMDGVDDEPPALVSLIGIRVVEDEERGGGEAARLQGPALQAQVGGWWVSGG